MNEELKSIKNLLKQIIEENNLQNALTQQKIKDAWRKVVGKTYAELTLDIQFNDGTLTIEMNGSAVKQEIAYAKSEIISKLNEILKENIVKQLVVK